MQSLKKNETDVIVAIVVMVVAAVPFTEVRLAEMDYARPKLDCAVAKRIEAGTERAEVNGTDTGTAYDATLATLGGATGRVPLWWGFVHVVSKAVVSASVAAVPCSHDVAGIQMRLVNGREVDAHLVYEAADFDLECHRAALGRWRSRTAGRNVRLVNGIPTAIPDEAEGRGYMGSKFFLETRGTTTCSIRGRTGRLSRVTRRGMRARSGRIRSAGNGGATGANGLRARLVGAIDMELRRELIYGPDATMKQETGNEGLSEGELEDALLRRQFAAMRAPRSGTEMTSLGSTAAEAAAAADNWAAAAGAWSVEIADGCSRGLWAVWGC